MAMGQMVRPQPTGPLQLVEASCEQDVPQPPMRLCENVLQDGTRITPYNPERGYARPIGVVDPPRRPPSTLSDFMGNPLYLVDNKRVTEQERLSSPVAGLTQRTVLRTSRCCTPGPVTLEWRAL